MTEDDVKTNVESGVREGSLRGLIKKVDAISLDMSLIKNLLKAQCDLLRKPPTKVKRVRVASKPAHPHTRCSIGKPWNAILEVDKKTRIYLCLSKYDGAGVFQREKFVGRTFQKTIQEHERIRRQTTSPHPTYFDSFFKTLIRKPHNCCFYPQGARYYVCMTDEDRWQALQKRDQFWDLLRYYLWETYRKYVELCVDEILVEHPEREDSLRDLQDQVANRNRDDIPLTRAYLLQLLNCMVNYGSVPSNITLLAAAYGNRKK